MHKKAKKNVYFEAGLPVHRLSYCAFMDVLGFTARSLASYKNMTGNVLLQEFHAIFKKRVTQLKSDVDESLLYFKSFTDNIVLAHPQISEDMESEFGLILVSISEYQYEMALQGYFIRGGLAVGPLFVDDNSVYGKALLDAYKLESKTAIYPIVVLCEDTMTFVDEHIGYYHGMSAPQTSTLLINAEGRYFINYLSECLVDTYEGEELDNASLKKHKYHIEQGLVQYAKQPSVLAKFTWLAAYHNYFCESVSLCSNYSDTLKIGGKIKTVNFGRLG